MHVGIITVEIGIGGYGFRNVSLGRVNQLSDLILICDAGSLKDLGQLYLNPSLNVRSSYLLLQPLIKVGNLLHGIFDSIFLHDIFNCFFLLVILDHGLCVLVYDRLRLGLLLNIFNRFFLRIILDLLFLYRFRLAHLGIEIHSLYLFFKEFSVTKLVIDLFNQRRSTVKVKPSFIDQRLSE